MGLLENKVAVITGSSRGLGYAIAETYAEQGAAVVLAARTTKAVDEAVAKLQARGFRATGAACDVANHEQVAALAEHAVQTFGQIDIWVNNAGVSGAYGPTAHLPNEMFERVINTNITGVYYGSVTALRYMVPRKTGKLINLLGRGEGGPVKHQNAYASSKAWVRSFTLALAQEYADSGVGVYAFNPGLVDTDMLHQLEAVQGYEQKLNPLRMVMRFWANPPEVPAQKALWLASSATDGKTGLRVNVLDLKQTVGGLLRDAGRRLTGKAAPNTDLNITTVQPMI